MPATVLDAIGNTPIAELRRVVPPGCARIVAKLEWGNPTGSMKDRMARAAIEAAERDGRLRPGGTVLEYTAGTTGVSLAFVCAAKGYGLHVVFSDAFSDEKRGLLSCGRPPVQSVGRPLRHLVAYGSTNKYRPVNRSMASGSSAKRYTQTAGSSCPKATMLTMTATVRQWTASGGFCRDEPRPAHGILASRSASFPPIMFQP
jgi:hypothetical protein